MKGPNPGISNASLKPKENLLEFGDITWADVHNRYESKIRVDNDQLGLPPSPINRIKNSDRPNRITEIMFQPPRDRYHPDSQPQRSTFILDKGRSGPRPTIVAVIGHIEGSTVNIIRWNVVEQLGLVDQIIPAAHVLNGFNMACENTKGEITLPVNAAGIIQHAKFDVIDGEMRYNTLLGRPWLHIMRAVPSALHQILKFLMSEGVKIIHGEQPAAKEMFIIEEAVQTSDKAPEGTEDPNEVENAK
ncbi:uncharacterized protein LOC132041994 [Lycium ferocissimum]|uniref:uncharacterized protein LOC132041994 n=1 Tax=Lycium ferocissimum TaxID=112874 RepID=UPI002814F9A6|nr:uncharacterized protein LOC132041994 [Lycium ferocissimum]